MIVKIVAIGITAAVLAVVLRKEKPEYAVTVSIACGLVILALVLNDLRAVLDTVKSVSVKSGISEQYIIMMVKIIGIAYLTEFAASIANDAGEGSIASKIQFAGKVSIIILSTPLFLSLLNLITGLLP